MSKQSGLAWTTASVDDSSGTPQAIVNDFTNLQFATPRGVQDSTGLDKSAMERILLLADFSITLTGVFNAAAGASHAVFSTVPSTSVARTVTLTIAAKTLACETLFSDYQLNRAQDGSFTFTAPGALSDGTVPTWA
jgi:hypothetical protein